MRKLSHISLAKYMIESLDDVGLRKHRLSFYLGSILPDIKPSFVYRRHEINRTFPIIRRNIRRLKAGKEAGRRGRKYYLDLGQISHFLADYFTFPHNMGYPGGIREHCSYEKKLKEDLRKYIRNGPAPGVCNRRKDRFASAEAVCNFIKKTHDSYIAGKHGVEDDIRHIVEVNRKMLEAMTR